MKIQKSLLAVIAMAGTMGFSAVASAMDFSVYGSLRGGIQQSERGDTTPATVASQGTIHATAGSQVNVDADTTFVGGDVTAPDGSLDIGHVSNGFSRLGIRGSEDLGNGAEAGVHWEAGVTGNGAFNSGRHANVWYSGAFGKVTIGQQSNPYRNAANWDQSFWIGGNNRYGDGGSRLQGVRYDGDAGAFNFSVMATANSDNGYTDDGLAEARTVDISADGTLIGANQLASTAEISYDEVESETGIDSWIATGHYDMGVATINLGYRVDNNEAQAVGQSWDNFVISANGTLDALDWYIAFESNTDNTNVKRTDTPIVFDANGTASTTVRTTALVEADTTANANTKAVADSLATAHDVTTIGLFLGYHLSDVSTIYFEWEDSANDGLDVLGENLDRTATLLGFSRSIGPNTSFIAEYVSVDNGSELSADSTTLQGYLKVDF
jgi:predicted porin